MSATKIERRRVPAKLIEATPGALGHWVLASPLILFLAWMLLDLFAHYSPIPWRWLDLILGTVFFLFVIVLPLGIAAHRLITTFPRLFQNAGWDVQPLEPVTDAEMYSVRYLAKEKEWASQSWNRWWLRAAQGWVYIEIAAILLGFAALGPLFFSAMEMGFGQ